MKTKTKGKSSAHYYNQMVEDNNKIMQERNQACKEQTTVKAKIDVLR